MASNREIRFGINIDTDSAESSLGKLINALNELQIEGGETDSSIDDINNALENLSNSSNTAANSISNIQQAAQTFDGIAKGLSGTVNIAVGSFGLLGVESEKVQEALLKVQSAVALTTGLKDLSESFISLSSNQAVASAATTAYTAVVGTSTGAMKAFKIALASTGVGLLVVGLGLLIANFDKIIEVVKNLIAKSEFLTKIFEGLKNIFGKVGDALGFNTKKTEEQTEAIENQNEATEKQIGLLEEQILKYTELVKKQKENSENINKDLQREIQLLKAVNDEEKDRLKLTFEKQDELSDLQKQREDGLLNEEQYQTAVNLALTKYALLLDDLNEKYKENDVIGAGVEDLTAKYIKLGKVIAANTEKIREQAGAAGAASESTGDEGEDLTPEEIAAATFNTLSDFNNLISQSFEARSQKRLNDIQNEEQKEIQSLQARAKAGLISEEQLENGLFEIEKKFDKKRQKEEKKAFKRQKAIRIVDALINTAVGVTSALGAPFPLNFISAALAGALGAAQVAIIARQKFPEGDGGDASGGGGGGIPSGPITGPSINQNAPEFGSGAVGGASNVGASGERFGSTDVKNQRVYVVESDITQTQNRVETIEDRASIG